METTTLVHCRFWHCDVCKVKVEKPKTKTLDGWGLVVMGDGRLHICSVCLSETIRQLIIWLPAPQFGCP